MFGKAKVEVVQERSLLKGMLAGLVGGLVATAGKSLAEKVFPPKTPGGAVSQSMLAQKISGKVGHELSVREQQAVAHTLHWGLGAAAGAAYGGVAEYFPSATGKDGANFGMALATFTHEGGLPALAFVARPKPQSGMERTSEVVSHVVFGLVTETVRRFLRKRL
jgi:putative membrane protein